MPKFQIYGDHIRLFAHYTTSLTSAVIPEGIELLKCLSDIFCLECTSKIRSFISIIFHAIYGTVHVCIQLIHFSDNDCENTCTVMILLSSSNRLYDQFAIVMKQWYALYVFLCSYKKGPNYANPVYGVATICHQVRWLRWGHPKLFHTATSLLIWYKMFCVRDISYRLIWMEFINMFSVYAKSGTHSRFNW